LGICAFTISLLLNSLNGIAIIMILHTVMNNWLAINLWSAAMMIFQYILTLYITWYTQMVDFSSCYGDSIITLHSYMLAHKKHYTWGGYGSSVSPVIVNSQDTHMAMMWWLGLL